VQVRLLSRALHFTPRGDREAFETWQPGEGGVWYSVYTPREAR
jgi:hypothetical protein